MDKNIRLFVRFAYIALPLQVQYVCGTLGISFFFVHLEIDIERSPTRRVPDGLTPLQRDEVEQIIRKVLTGKA